MTWILFLRLIVDIVVLGVVILIIATVINARNVSPPISTRKKVLKEVVDTFGKLPSGSVFYDIGSGTGQVVLAMAASNKDTTCIGIEKYYAPYVLACFNAWRSGLTNISFRRTDMLRESYADGTHIYTYLYPETMERLLPHLTRNLTTGTTLVSLDFPFKTKTALSVQPILGREHEMLGRTLFTYQF